LEKLTSCGFYFFFQWDRETLAAVAASTVFHKKVSAQIKHIVDKLVD